MLPLGAAKAAAVIHVETAVRATGRIINDVQLHLWTFDA